MQSGVVSRSDYLVEVKESSRVCLGADRQILICQGIKTSDAHLMW